jgi:hypothetical protein
MSVYSNGLQLPARYRFVVPIGEGSMGAVVCVTDRLTGQEVALKQVLLPADIPPDTIEHELLTLAHEFRVLAGLRHPNIISVLDYGFDGARQPFYTMDVLQGSATILAAGQALPLVGKVELLIQALEALAYLHRRGVLHHDLKPANMLVANGQVRLLDFGLAVLASQQRDDDAFGTLQYLAPEVLDGAPYTEAADLYSLGVIAYELLVGRYPFDVTSAMEFLTQVHIQAPDLSALADQPALAEVVRQLLAKAPADRPPTAQATIAALAAAARLPEKAGDVAIRESYLQAAAFVGRDAELALLTAALEQASVGQGRAFLIGGESGVGKSRLLDELRTQALVQGFQVLRGQAVAEGGSPFQLWRALVRHLALATPLDPLEAGILKELAPDLERLLERQVADAPPLSSGAQQRLVATLASVLARQRQPTLILLEDLQWASEGLELLHALVPQLTQLPIVIIGTYRIEERPDLPAMLPATIKQLRLARLSDAATAQLATAILGVDAQQAALIQKLQAETEGNAFFLVELLRAWAEESGGLEQIRSASLSQRLLTGGMAVAVRRRLAKVPAAHQELLLLAAIAGRELDLAMLGALSDPATLAGWLQAGSEAAILEVAEQRWRFTHDKLREVLLQDALPDMLALGHARVAQAIEQVYPDARPFAFVLAEHWRAAGDSAKVVNYSVVACEQLRWAGSYAMVVQLAQRVLAECAALLPAATHIQLLKHLGESYCEWDRYPESIAVFREGLALARAAQDRAAITQFLNGLGWSLWRDLQYSRSLDNTAVWAEAEACFHESYLLAEALGDRAGMADSLHNQGMVMGIRDAELRRGSVLLQRALELYQAAQDTQGMSIVLADLASFLMDTGEYDQAQRYALAALAQAQAIGSPVALPYAYFHLVCLAIILGDWPQVAAYSPPFVALAAAPEHLFHWESRFLAAVLAYHQHDDARVRQLSAGSLHATAGHFLPIWQLRCLVGLVAIEQADHTGLAEALRSVLDDLGRTSVQSHVYLLLLAAGACFLNRDVARGASWLGCFQAHADTLVKDVLHTHLTEVSERISSQFATILASPQGQAGLAAGAGIPFERVLELLQGLAVGATDRDQLLGALDG